MGTFYGFSSKEMHHRFIYFALSTLYCAVAALTAAGQDVSFDAAPAIPLSLTQFLERVTAVHPAFRAERLGVEVAGLERDAVGAGEDWVFRASPYLGFEEPVSNSSFSPSDARTLGVNASLERPYWNSGARLGLDYDYSYIDQDVATFPSFGPNGEVTQFETGLPEFHQHALMIRYTRPLRRGRGGLNDRLALDRSEMALRSAQIEARENMEDVLLRVGGLYLDWVLAHAERDIADRRATLSEAQRASVIRRFTQNQGRRVDVLRAESDVVASAQRLGMAELEVARLEVQLRRLALLDAANYRPSFALYQTPRVAAPGEAPLGVRVLRAFDVEAERVRREALSLDDAVKPQLDVDLRAGLSGGDPDFIDSAALDQPDFRAGIVFRKPLGNLTAKKRAEANVLRSKQILAQRDRVALDLRSALDSFALQQGILLQMLELNQLQIQLAEKQQQAELEQYIQAKSPLTFVLQAQDAVAAAETTRAQTAARFHKVGLEMRALLDQLLP